MSGVSIKVYIAGKVTGVPLHILSGKFGTVEVMINNKPGHEAVCPLNICNRTDNWHTAMRKCIVAMMQCDEVYFMPCWKDSKGARIEHLLCKTLKIPITYL